jgi:hypothetical protein
LSTLLMLWQVQVQHNVAASTSRKVWIRKLFLVHSPTCDSQSCLDKQQRYLCSWKVLSIVNLCQKKLMKVLLKHLASDYSEIWTQAIYTYHYTYHILAWIFTHFYKLMGEGRKDAEVVPHFWRPINVIRIGWNWPLIFLWARILLECSMKFAVAEIIYWFFPRPTELELRWPGRIFAKRVHFGEVSNR